MTNIEAPNLKDALQENFGFDKFKGKQEEIISSLMAGNDVFVLMPTGGGKSLCYQLPALVMEGTAIVISPLIALMKNQVDLLRGYSDNDKITHFYNSTLNKTQKNEVLNDVASGRTKLLYVAPETLNKEENLEFFSKINISFIAIDEAHCISEWGHDFRPEYRNIRKMANAINPNLNVIALTATATPKVREDIVKTLQLENPKVFVDSFNRANLYYEIRPKKNDDIIIKDILQFIKKNEGKSGIVYVINRKTSEKVADTLKLNGVKAAAYHGGMDAKTRSKTQDDFLMERIDVVVATIAFGMGIDKPDIRFVIHYDMPKSIENYYQETGRAGRDGLEGNCLTFFSYKDIGKLEHLLKDKTVTERERNMQLIDETVAYIESSLCRREYLLHYFGEDYTDTACTENKMCDNCKQPKEKVDATDDLKILLESIFALNEKVDIKYLVKFLTGVKSQEIKAANQDKLPHFGAFKGKEVHYINALIRRANISNFLRKDIIEYGVLKVTDSGKTQLEKPSKFEVAKDQDYHASSENIVPQAGGVVLDDTLLKMLKDLRREVATEHNLPPYVIFQDASLEDMATQFPISSDEFANIQGVSKGKALRYGKQFSDVIRAYVEENDIDRHNDFVVKTTAKKSGDKVKIIQSIDQKLTVEDIAQNLGKTRQEVIDEMETIVNSGTKLDLNYYLNEQYDEELVEEIFEYFQESETGSLDEAYEEFEEEELEHDDLQLIRIKFLSEMGN